MKPWMQLNIFCSLTFFAVFFVSQILPPDRWDSFFTQDTACFHPQYYLLQKALSDTALREKHEQIRINMERWKALPPFLGEYYLFVNTADFRLDVVEYDSVVMSMRVVVGRNYRKTPVFHASLTHIVFNPTWNIPPNILKKDILPEILKDTAFLRNNHIGVFQNDSHGVKKEILQDTIDWAKISWTSFPYELIQEPWEKNVLGAIKFVFPNRYNVYMHDSPFKQLFEETEPAFSSGCIRLSNAVALAVLLLESEKGWDEKKIAGIIRSGKNFTVYLSKPVEVYIQYFTAWMDASGKIQFRKDIYNRDITDKNIF